MTTAITATTTLDAGLQLYRLLCISLSQSSFFYFKPAYWSKHFCFLFFFQPSLTFLHFSFSFVTPTSFVFGDEDVTSVECYTETFNYTYKVSVFTGR